MSDPVQELFKESFETLDNSKDKVIDKKEVTEEKADVIIQINESSAKEEGYPSKSKSDEVRKKEDVKETKSDESYDEKIKSLEKALKDTQRWGQEKQQSYVLAKKRLSKIADNWKENELLTDEDKESLVGVFNSDYEESAEASQSNPYENIVNRLNAELVNYKKYNKNANIDDVDSNFMSFFESFPYLSENEKKDLTEYLHDAEPSEAIERVLTIGSDNKNALSKVSKKDKNLLGYVNRIESEKKALQQKYDDLKAEIDNRYGKVNNRSIQTRSSDNKELKKANVSDEALIELFG